jgi:hypothetical protein
MKALLKVSDNLLLILNKQFQIRTYSIGHVYLSACNNPKTADPDFHEIWYWEFLQEIPIVVKSDSQNRYCTFRLTSISAHA